MEDLVGDSYELKKDAEKSQKDVKKEVFDQNAYKLPRERKKD